MKIRERFSGRTATSDENRRSDEHVANDEEKEAAEGDESGGESCARGGHGEDSRGVAESGGE